MTVWLSRSLFLIASIGVALAAVSLFGSGVPSASAHAPESGVVSKASQDDPPLATPVRLLIPSLQINAPIEPVGLEDDGGMSNPSDADSVAWFAPGFRPGDAGSAVMAGHVDWVNRAAVFWFIKDLSAGDEVDVVYDDGSSIAFSVDEIDSYLDTEAPMEQIFSASDTPHLNLVTCGGSFDRSTHNYDHRTVVYTTMIQQ